MNPIDFHFVIDIFSTAAFSIVIFLVLGTVMLICAPLCIFIQLLFRAPIFSKYLGDFWKQGVALVLCMMVAGIVYGIKRAHANTAALAISAFAKP